MKRDLGALEGRVHDVLVVGGGVHGAAIAREASRRGLSVALVEADDFASGASWNSLKTIHGGLRHLQRGHLWALRESARDRAAWLRLAPALVRPLPFLVPARGHGLRGREALAAGVFAAHALAADVGRDLPPELRLPRPRVLTAAAVRARVPGLDLPQLSGGVLWHDAQAKSSERLVIALLHAAAYEGAALANRARAEALLLEHGAVEGATVRDLVGGGRLTVRARATVNAAGAAFEGLLPGGAAPARVPWLRAFNLVLRRPAVAEVAVGGRAGGRYLFLVPWRDRAIVGTAYAPTDADVPTGRRTLLREAQEAFPWAGLEPSDVSLVHEGLVPGRGDASGLLPVSRVVDHAAQGARGLFSVVAVKFTTALSVARTVAGALGARGGGDGPELPQARPLGGPLDAQARSAVREEMALTLADVVLRRLDLGAGGRPDDAALAAVAEAVSRELGWDEARLAAERDGLAGFFAARRFG